MFSEFYVYHACRVRIGSSVREVVQQTAEETFRVLSDSSQWTFPLPPWGLPFNPSLTGRRRMSTSTQVEIPSGPSSNFEVCCLPNFHSLWLPAFIYAGMGEQWANFPVEAFHRSWIIRGHFDIRHLITCLSNFPKIVHEQYLLAFSTTTVQFWSLHLASKAYRIHCMGDFSDLHTAHVHGKPLSSLVLIVYAHEKLLTSH